MKPNILITIIVVVFVLVALIWAIVLQATGHPTEAIEFMKYAFGGIGSACCAILFLKSIRH